MKRVLSVLFFCSFCWLSSYSQLSFGLGGSYVADGGAFGISGKGLLGLSENIDFAPTFTFWLEDGVDYSFDLDVHYRLLNISDNIILNPLAGINITKAASTEIGINIGASFRYQMNEGGAVYFEPKYVIDNFNSLVFGFGYFF